MGQIPPKMRPVPRDHFADVRDKRMSELNEEQTLRARELWIRENIGFMREYDRPLYQTLLDVIDHLRNQLGTPCPVNPADLLPEERDCCGTFPGTPHRSTCHNFKEK